MMVKKMKLRLASVALFGALAGAAILLTACGGGGGGGETTPPPVVVTPPATVSVALNAPSATATVQADLGVASVTFNWSVSNGGTVTLRRTSDGLIVATGAAGPATVNVPLGASTYQLYNGDTPIGSPFTVTASCGAGLSVVAGVCKAPVVVRYGESLIGYWGGTNGLPRKTLSDGTQVNMVNKTKYPAFGNCLPVEKANSDGLIPHSCGAIFGSDRYNDVALNPVTMEMVDALAPVGAKYVPQTYDAARNPVDRPTWRTSARYQNGDYAFVDGASNSVVRKLLANGTESVIYTGTFERDNGCLLLMIFSNP